MISKTSRRNPLKGAPDTQDIMKSARRRNVNPVSGNTQNASVPARHNDSIPANTKVTYYLNSSIPKKLKRYAFETDSSQSKVVERAILEYIKNHPI